jgi:hypothetical protein
MTCVSASDRRRLLALWVTASSLLACEPQERVNLRVDASRCQISYWYDLRVVEAGSAEPCLLSSATSLYVPGAEVAVEVSSAERVGVVVLLYSTDLNLKCVVCHGLLWMDSPERELVLQPDACTSLDPDWTKIPDCPGRP